MTPGLVDEIVVIDLLALFLAVAAVEIIWYVVKKAFPDQVRDLRFFLTFIVVIVPFVMLTYFGAAIIIYDAITAPPWPIALPAKPSSRELLAVAVPYIGLTVWLWLRWRKL